MKSSYCDILGISQYDDFIPRYTELCWVHRGMGDFIDTQFCYILEWFSNVWICTHACPITRHRDLESKPKKSCSDFDLSILRSYRYIPVYTEYNSVYTMRIQNQGQLSYFVLHGSILVLVHASIHHPCTVQCSLQPKVKKMCAYNRLDRLSKKRYILRYTMHSLVYIEIPPFSLN